MTSPKVSSTIPPQTFPNLRPALPPTPSQSSPLTSITHDSPSPNPFPHEHPVGGVISAKPSHCIRVSSINPGGIRLQEFPNELQHSLSQSVDIQGYSEINLDTTQLHVRNTLRDTCKRYGHPATRSTWGSSSIEGISPFKPGGTGIITFGSHGGRLHHLGNDPYGRWSYQYMRCTNDTSILSIVIYQCCARPTNKVGCTAYHQQESLFIQEGRVDPNPRQHFIPDLKHFVTTAMDTHKGTLSLILMGDWNSPSTSSPIQSLMTDLGLVDPWLSLHPNHPDFPTYHRGRRRIDFALVSSELCPYITTFIYEPFKYRLSGDHRGFYFDLDVSTLFSHQSISPVTSRTFSSKDQKAIKVYLQAFHNFMQLHNIKSRLDKLLSSSVPDHAEAEALDADLIRASRAAENKCRVSPRDYWSVDLHLLKQELSIYSQLCHRKHKHLDCTALLTRAAALNFQIPPDVTVPQLRSHMRQLRLQIKTLLQESAAKRDSFLLEQANIAMDTDDPGRAQCLRQLRRQEKRNAAYRRLRHYRQQVQTGPAISQIQIPLEWTSFDPSDLDTTLVDPKTVTDPTDWVTITTPSEIEKYLQLRNQRHFGQAETEKTPFTQPPLKTHFNWSASTQAAELVLDGTFSDTEYDHVTSLFLRHLHRVTSLDSLPAQISHTDFTTKFTKWRESTSTSPSGRHLGHYKLLFREIHEDDEDVLETLQQIQASIQHCYISILNYVLKHRYSFKRWQTIVNLMIYKDLGNTKSTDFK